VSDASAFLSCRTHQGTPLEGACELQTSYTDTVLGTNGKHTVRRRWLSRLSEARELSNRLQESRQLELNHFPTDPDPASHSPSNPLSVNRFMRARDALGSQPVIEPLVGHLAAAATPIVRPRRRLQGRSAGPRTPAAAPATPTARCGHLFGLVGCLARADARLVEGPLRCRGFLERLERLGAARAAQVQRAVPQHRVDVRAVVRRDLERARPAAEAHVELAGAVDEGRGNYA